MTRKRQLDDPIIIEIGHEEVVIRRRYEVASIANDFLIAVWFLVGSLMFLDPETVKLGTWLFVLGSFQLLIRPTIRLAGHIHLQHVPANRWES
jgi:hypothetical protein